MLDDMTEAFSEEERAYFRENWIFVELRLDGSVIAKLGDRFIIKKIAGVFYIEGPVPERTAMSLYSGIGREKLHVGGVDFFPNPLETRDGKKVWFEYSWTYGFMRWSINLYRADDLEALDFFVRTIKKDRVHLEPIPVMVMKLTLEDGTGVTHYYEIPKLEALRMSQPTGDIRILEDLARMKPRKSDIGLVMVDKLTLTDLRAGDSEVEWSTWQYEHPVRRLSKRDHGLTDDDLRIQEPDEPPLRHIIKKIRETTNQVRKLCMRILREE